jgi:site-specific recombinase XerD
MIIHNPTRLPAACAAVIDGPFTLHLRGRGFAPRTIDYTRWAVRYAARFLAQRKRSLDSLTLGQLSGFLRKSAPDYWYPSTRVRYMGGLRRWFRFKYPECVFSAPQRHSFAPKLYRGKPAAAFPWHRWVCDYLQFLDTHRGLAWRTRRGHGYVVCDYLHWQFGQHDVSWTQVAPESLWRYAREFARDRHPGTLNSELSIIRHFLDFAHMRGACSVRLVHAVPRYSNFGYERRFKALDERQRKVLLASFDRHSLEGLRDYAMALCMVDLGLRPQETVALRSGDFDQKLRWIDIPPTKTDRGRRLPVPPRICAVLRAYFEKRPQSPCPYFFVWKPAGGQHAPMNTRVLRQIINKAYRRCGFPDQCSGSYHLRHTFATRLYASGAELKQIADFMGHRHLKTTIGYTKVDIGTLRPLALPWPIQAQCR